MSSTTLEPELTAAPATGTNRLSARDRIRMGMSLAWLRLKEYVTCDSRLARGAFAVSGYCLSVVLGWLGLRERQFKLLCRLHRADLSTHTNAVVEREVSKLFAGDAPNLERLVQSHIDHPLPTPSTTNFHNDHDLLLSNAAIVLKSPTSREKGLILVHYNGLIALFASYFDVDRIAERYHIVLEPSWTGFCDLDLLTYFCRNFPVFVQAYEPRDAAFLRNVHANVVTFPVGGNWWVDHRVFRPLSDAVKDIDLVMLAGWGSYKRHHRFFDALARLRRQGHRPRVMLVGYAAGWSKATVMNQARYYGIEDQLEIHEGVPYEQVNALVNRARVHVLWSRKEGFPRATIECMFAGLPSIVRKGFNNGYRYPYINDQTGCFADEESLPEAILETLERSTTISPRNWVLENMSCQRATEIMWNAIGSWCRNTGQPWSDPAAVKVTRLHGLRYWNEADSARFASDYEFLKSVRRKH